MKQILKIKNYEVELEIYNSNLCILKGSKNCLFKKNLEGVLTGISLDNYSWKINDEIFIPVNEDFEYRYKIRYIDKHDDLIYFLYEFKANDSRVFLTPMLGDDRSLFGYSESSKTARGDMLCNTFIDCTFPCNYNNGEVLFLLYKPAPTDKYINLKNTLKENEYFIDIINNVHGDKRYNLFIFKIPEKYRSDYEKFIQGDFIGFSKELKSQILKFHKINPNSYIGKKTLIYNTLYNTKEFQEIKMKQLGISEKEWRNQGFHKLNLRDKPNIYNEII